MRYAIVGLLVLASAACSERQAVAAPTRVEALQAKLSRSTAGLSVQVRPDGIRKVDLGGRFSHATVLEHDARKRSCLDSPAAVTRRD